MSTSATDASARRLVGGFSGNRWGSAFEGFLPSSVTQGGGSASSFVGGVPSNGEVFMRRWLSAVVGVGMALVAAPSVALAAPPDPSSVAVSATALAPGQTFTVSVDLFNPTDFTVVSAKAQLRTLEVPAVDLFDLVACTGTTVDCFPLGSSFRGPVGDLGPGQERTVVFTFRVKDTVAAGNYTLEHTLVGDNFAFAPATGPVLTIAPRAADLAVSLDASSRGLLTSQVTYTVAVTNHGPGGASSARVSGTYVAGFSWAGGHGCVRTTGRNVQCDFSAIPVGGTASASFSVDAGLLALGSFSTSVSRTSSTPSDPNSGNDSASRSCTALTGLIVRC
ncbi:hypothetical protein [Actinophytocola sp.]|uniref:hypothetical protein n=1 Tax=Actinophytocola sp. TaxID=1872138 RepID=UPI00389AA993